MKFPRGFTLIEIAFAIIILAGSFVVLLSLNSSATRRAIDDRDRQQAMLVARRILAAIEVAQDPIETQDRTGSAREILARFVEESDSDRENRFLDRFKARLNVTLWGIPNLNPEAMKQISLTIGWGLGSNGSAGQDEVKVLYFVPHEAATPDPTPPPGSPSGGSSP